MERLRDQSAGLHDQNEMLLEEKRDRVNKVEDDNEMLQALFHEAQRAKEHMVEVMRGLARDRDQIQLERQAHEQTVHDARRKADVRQVDLTALRTETEARQRAEAQSALLRQQFDEVRCAAASAGLVRRGLCLDEAFSSCMGAVQ